MNQKIIIAIFFLYPILIFIILNHIMNKKNDDIKDLTSKVGENTTNILANSARLQKIKGGHLKPNAKSSNGKITINKTNLLYYTQIDNIVIFSGSIPMSCPSKKVGQSLCPDSTGGTTITIDIPPDFKIDTSIKYPGYVMSAINSEGGSMSNGFCNFIANSIVLKFPRPKDGLGLGSHVYTYSIPLVLSS